MLTNDAREKLAQYMEKLKRGDNDTIYYNFHQWWGGPIVGYSMSSSPCRTLIVLIKNAEGMMAQGYICGNEQTDFFQHSAVSAVWIIQKPHNTCEILLEFEGKPPLIVSAENTEEFVLFAQGEAHSQLCMFDTEIQEGGFSMVIGKEDSGYHFAKIVGPYVDQYRRGIEE